jgi:hypothetical protein
MRRSVSILLCSFPDSWDSLVMAIGSNTTTLVLEDVVASLFVRRNEKKEHGRIDQRCSSSERSTDRQR